MSINIKEKFFGKLKDGSQVFQYTLSNRNGMTVKILNYGATIQSISLKDLVGRNTDVCLGFDTIEGYLGPNPYFGCVVGRVGNRISGGKFNLDGVEYQLAKNDGENSIHGGIKGFDTKVWNAYILDDGVCFTYLSKDGEEGYPGDVIINATYKLTYENALDLSFIATTTKPTPINLSSHCYFNLAGHDSGAENGLYNHEVCISSDQYTPVMDDWIPTGEIANVGSNPVYDLRIPKKLGDILPFCPVGYSHNYLTNPMLVNAPNLDMTSRQSNMRFACIIKHITSGRRMECYTNQPGLLFYTGFYIPNDGSVKGKGGVVYAKDGGFCLETEVYPDSVNQKAFPCDSILRPGQVYDHRVTYKFFDF